MFLPGESPHGQGSLADYSPWGRKESDMTEASQCVCVYTYIHTYIRVCVCVCVCVCVNQDVNPEATNISFFLTSDSTMKQRRIQSTWR